MTSASKLLASLDLPAGASLTSIRLRRWAWMRDENGYLELHDEAASDELYQEPAGREDTNGWADGVSVMLSYVHDGVCGEVEVVDNVGPEQAPHLADMIAGAFGVSVSTYDGLA